MSFDLNISNYKIKELEDMFELPKNYNLNEISDKEEQIIKGIYATAEISKETKVNTINFLIKAKEILIKNCSNQSTPDKELATLNKNMKTYFHDTDNKLSSSKIKEEGSGILISKPVSEYVNSNLRSTFAGDMNPLSNSTTIKKFLNIDTRFRENYYGTLSSNFGLNLPMSINNVTTMQLSAIELPNTLYSVSKIFGTNYFSVARNGVAKNIIIPDGNYDAASLCAYLTNYMINIGGYFADICFILDSDGTSQNGSGKIIISLIDAPSNNSTFSVSFQQDISGADNKTTPLPLKIGWKMGFRNGVYENNTTYVAEGLPDLSGPKYIYLAVDDFNNNVNNGFYSAFTSSIMNNNILARVSLQGTALYNEYVNETANAYVRSYFGPVNINKLQIQLLDEYGRTLDFNNMDFSFCLTMEVIYDL